MELNGHRDLRALFAPESVAVVGASDDEGKWGNEIAREGAVARDARINAASR